MEYRCYGLAGIATMEPSAEAGGAGVLHCRRAEGKLVNLSQRYEARARQGNAESATPAGPNMANLMERNAHPHRDGSGEVAVVQNRIIKKHRSLREELEGEVMVIGSDDGTQAIPHLLNPKVQLPPRRRSRLERFRNHHQGETLILVCNGPSLNNTDFSLIRRQTCMGLNKIHLGLKRFAFQPRYFVAINERVMRQAAKEIGGLNCIRFIKDIGEGNPIPESALTYHIRPRTAARFHEDLTRGFHEGYTVTFAALQIAYFMGFKKVVIVGMDHRYSYQGAPNVACELIGRDTNHFDPTYFSGHTWNNPDLANSERFYALARKAFESAGGRIIDCTVDGACTVFEKGRLEEVL